MNREEIIKLIEEVIARYNTKQGGSTGSFTVPFHRHNGSDSPKVIMGDLAYDQRGIFFPTVRGPITLKGDSTNTGLSLQTVPTLSGPFIIGNGGQGFSVITNQAYQNFNVVVDNGTNKDTLIVLPEKISIIASISSSLTDGWKLQLPNNVTLPPNPQVGDICIFNGVLQVCEVAGIWTAK